ncbi:hypothetical protein KOW79_013245 [Hemibagrus wyckioides]|uniref:BHLH domain-containing protein n=2 Tax=Hemibagrus wyckioides TaxID=337641 RepID=A0A9D3NIH9_9TELE|nr:hypothetical protein KOW79_013245 [Hemibagrus wyckioides]
MSQPLCSWSVGKAIQHKPHGFVMEMANYKYRALTLTQLRKTHFAAQKETETSMAPHSVIISTFNYQRYTDKDKFKLRKPMVEKMRRDRINNCIDQLKKLLEKELCSQDTKLEKADILEMTVSFLKQQQRLPGALAQRDYNQGYSQCWKESLHFLNIHSNRGQSTQEVQEVHQRSSTELSNRLSVHNSKHSHAAQQQPVWRPW